MIWALLAVCIGLQCFIIYLFTLLTKTVTVDVYQHGTEPEDMVIISGERVRVVWHDARGGRKC